MKYLSFRFFIAVLLFPLLSAAQDFDYGTIENNTYTNLYFKFHFDIPKDWHIQSSEFTKQLTEAGAKRMADDAYSRKIFEESIQKTAMFVTVFKYEVGAPVDYNPSVLVMSENIKAFPGMKTGADYLFSVKKILKSVAGAENREIDEEFVKETIGGQEFYRMHLKLTLMGITVYQDYYTSIINGYALNFVFSYGDDGQKDELEAVKKTVSFTK